MRSSSLVSAVALALLAVVATSCGGDDDGAVDGTDETESGSTDSTATVTEPDSTDSAATETESVSTDAAGATDDVDDVAEQAFPDVIAVEATGDGGTWTFAVTISSPYDTPERYADAWRVVGPDGEVYGERILLHDHAGEQPFTRSQSGIEIPADVETVVVEARDLVNGWGGGTMLYDLPDA